jgi:glutathione S-transferase
MKLHTIPGSPNSRKVQAVIAHLNLDVEIEAHPFADVRGPAFRAINPNALVPVLVDGAFLLWESNAIIQYLAEKAGDTALYPRDAKSRADIARWHLWEALYFNKAFGTLAFETVAKARLNLGPADTHAVEAAKTDLTRFAPVLERHLEGRKFVVGENLTIADYALLKLEAYRTLVPFDWSPFANINAYFDRLHMLEPWQRTSSDRKMAA